MNPTPAATRLLTALALACALSPTRAVAQEQPLVVDPKGDHAFRHVLKKVNRLTPLKELGDLRDVRPEDTVVIVFGDLACLDQLAQDHGVGLRQFVDRGGAVLIASDRMGGQSFREEFGVRITGLAVTLPPSRRPLLAPGWVFLQGPKGEGPIQVTPGEYEKAKETRLKGWSPVDLELSYPNRFEPILISQQDWDRQQAELYLEGTNFIRIKNHFGVDHPVFKHFDKGVITDQPSYLVLESPVGECAVLSCFLPIPS